MLIYLFLVKLVQNSVQIYQILFRCIDWFIPVCGLNTHLFLRIVSLTHGYNKMNILSSDGLLYCICVKTIHIPKKSKIFNNLNRKLSAKKCLFSEILFYMIYIHNNYFPYDQFSNFHLRSLINASAVAPSIIL